jgi:hypothetical protein
MRKMNAYILLIKPKGRRLVGVVSIDWDIVKVDLK